MGEPTSWEYGYTLMLNFSRSITKVDIPDVTGLKGRFIYNFFVPDEMVNDNNPLAYEYQGAMSPEKVQNILTGSHETARFPRFISLSWNATSSGKLQTDDTGAETEARKKINWNLEQNVTRAGEVFYSFSDSNKNTRYRKLLNRLLSVYVDDPSSIDKRSMLQTIIPSLDIEKASSILSLNKQEGINYVNNMGQTPDNEAFAKSSKLVTTAVMDRRVWSNSLATYKNRVDPAQASMQSHAESAKSNAVDQDVLSSQPINLRVFDIQEKPSTTPITTESKTIGYIIDRTHIVPSDPKDKTKKPETILKTYIVQGADVTNFIDTKIVYGVTYTYVIRTISLVSAVIEVSPNPVPGGMELDSNKRWQCYSSVVSDKSNPIMIVTKERTPPNAPDGLVLKFDYSSNEGLHLFWQFPAGRQRDVKYFQVFKRKSINDPFTCISQIDFNDAKKKHSLFESVISENILKVSNPTTHYRDALFTRTESGYIYAIAAVDAHGLSSGYSLQVHAGFDKRKNRLALKRVSQPNAPKQYPNFFIDPDLDDNVLVDSFTQDAMRVSLKTKVTVYFDPDVLIVSSNQANENAGELTFDPIIGFKNLGSNNNASTYKMLLLNVDRQKSKVLELNVNDVRV
jgi:hypothetical protein